MEPLLSTPHVTAATFADIPYHTRLALYRITVDPALASAWLLHVHDNRGVKRFYLTRYTAAMKAGQWMENGECIKFSVSGKLIDGQHRLRAIVDSGVTLVLNVMVGLPDAAGLTVDIGANRTATDIVSMHGLVTREAAMLGGAIRLLINHERSNALWSVAKPSNAEIDAYLREHDELLASVQSIKTSCIRNTLYPPALAVALHSMFVHKGAEEANDFFFRLYRGVNIGADDPVYALRRYCEMRSTVVGRARFLYDYSVRTVKCWNATRLGRTAKGARMVPNAKDAVLPEII